MINIKKNDIYLYNHQVCNEQLLFAGYHARQWHYKEKDKSNTEENNDGELCI